MSHSQQQRVWLRCLHAGHYEFSLDGRDPYTTVFLLKYSDQFERVEKESWIY